MASEDTSTGTRFSLSYAATLAVFVIAGMMLRLWQWSSQLFLDDEWHAFGFVMERSLDQVIFQHGMGANSIPVNLWFWLTLNTVGWSEVILRLPSMIAAALALIILPLLVKRLWGPSVSLIFAALLTVSPLVIFYSRVVRPFAPAMLFGTASLLLTLLWIRDGRRRDLLISVMLGFLAIYYHLYSAIPVLVPLLVAAAASIKPIAGRIGLATACRTPWPTILTAAGLLSLLLGIFVVTPNLLNPWWRGVQGMSRANSGTLLTFVEFIAGTARYNLSLVMFILVPLGCGLLLVRSRTLGAAFVCPILVFIAVIATYTQDGAHAGIQAARYGIVFFPVFFIAIAIAVDWCADKLSTSSGGKFRWLPLAAMIVLWLPFLLTSPLWSIYRAPNNFTNHSGYQYHYAPISWELSPKRDFYPDFFISADEVPSIYRMSEVLSKYRGIIEYPMVIGDHYNLLFYYQHFHRLPVVAGYTRNDRSNTFPLRGEWVYADKSIDYVMTRIPSHLVEKSSRWRTMTDIENIQQLRKSYNNWLIILHRNPLRMIMEHAPEFGTITSTTPDLTDTGAASMHLTKNFGAPMIMSNHVVVWVVR